MRLTSVSRDRIWQLLPLAIVTGVVAATNNKGLDIIQDRVVSRVVLEGGNPYVPLEQLAPELAGFTWPSPRLPGALLLQLPTAFAEPRTLIVIMTVANALVLLWLLPRKWWIWSPLLFAAQPLLESVVTANTAILAGAFVVATWRGKSGIWLGLAATLRLFPLAFALPLLLGGRKRAAVETGATFLALNAVGLLFPAITMRGTIDSLDAARAQLDGTPNISIPSLAWRLGASQTGSFIVSAAFLALIVAWLLWRRPRWESGMAVSVPAVLFSMPVCWSPYLLMAAPAILALPISGVLWFLPPLGVDKVAITASLIWLTVWQVRRVDNGANAASPKVPGGIHPDTGEAIAGRGP